MCYKYDMLKNYDYFLFEIRKVEKEMVINKVFIEKVSIDFKNFRFY